MRETKSYWSTAEDTSELALHASPNLAKIFVGLGDLMSVFFFEDQRPMDPDSHTQDPVQDEEGRCTRATRTSACRKKKRVPAKPALPPQKRQHAATVSHLTDAPLRNPRLQENTCIVHKLSQLIRGPSSSSSAWRNFLLVKVL